MKNYICTAEGFIKSMEYSQESQGMVIEYTDKLRYAQTFNTKGALNFMERHNIKGFVYKPYEEEPIRNMYVVKKAYRYGFEREKKDNNVEEWIVQKAIMANESDVKFLMSKKLVQEDMMTFEEAKAKALELNTQLMSDLINKIDVLKDIDEKNVR